MLRNVTVISDTHQVFGSLLVYKGYLHIGSTGGDDKIYTETIGETSYSWATGSEQPRWSISFYQEIIQTILFDSLGTASYHSYHREPEIIIEPIHTTTSSNVTFEFQVDHPYTIGVRNFIDSVLILSYYARNDSVINNNPISVPSIGYQAYRETILLVDSLFRNGFNFYYKIKAKDKGIIPEYDFAPDSGYYELTYIDTSATAQIQFFPSIDTAWIGGGCVEPDIVTHNLISTSIRDSITIGPGSNSYFFYYDSLGNQVPVEKYYFIVIDSLDEYEYELWFHPKTSLPFDSVLITFDSTFYIDQHNFDIELIVKISDISIESYIQSFKADWGLGVGDDELLPKEYKLFQNYPNPFNPTTTIKYQIPELSFVTLKVYDVLGNEIAILVNGEKPAGSYEVEWDAFSLPSSIYFYRLQAGDFIQTKKMVLIK
ncbi:MAG: hypothetical protein DRQ13_01145 [Ignavibacteriae bacterium]|nr:MAG: hypothetical protein DRQ13_01145 [Ignavibacteriota bacterium]